MKRALTGSDDEVQVSAERELNGGVPRHLALKLVESATLGAWPAEETCRSVSGGTA
jgi:hypothetical protein